MRRYLQRRRDPHATYDGLAIGLVMAGVRAAPQSPGPRTGSDSWGTGTPLTDYPDDRAARLPRGLALPTTPWLVHGASSRSNHRMTWFAICLGRSRWCFES